MLKIYSNLTIMFIFFVIASFKPTTHLLVIKSNYPADDDECTNRICQHKCNNTKGECEIRKWGINCANYCNCVNGECDPVFGCQCDAGFSGSKCDQDVNECKITGICNDPYKTCLNTYGSYDCRCKDGYYEENKICKKISKDISGITLSQFLSLCLTSMNAMI
ncbi:hypothetical protein KUTeg_014894 [Tegillarca granosa]|uniref:EGF-like domain-containing protein n=1 Tax=Tegillarca granosa TaxID=220873 RepID=A0ABQ9ETS7_TEGGR|nr:hypothetical protein KUTeg_014894 [Tegillarca granosa]